MKIAYFTSNRTTIPPEKNIIAASSYLTSLLVEKMVEKGHEVTLYAAKGSQTKAKLIDLDLPAPQLDFSLKSEEWVKNMNLGMKQVYLSELYKHANEYDVIHLQTEPVYLGMPFARMTSVPTVVTNHNMFLEQEKSLLDYYKNIPIVTISEYQKSQVSGLNYIGTVYDGIDVDTFPFYAAATTNDYMYFTGRLVANKGTAEAIKISQMTKKNLYISGIGTEAYITEVITPYLSDTISYLGGIERASKEWFDKLGQARAVLFPVQWEEPFGLVMTESMACGTPVIAYARGSVPEVIKDGETGFIVNPSDNDIRGNWIIKKTGVEGFAEAIQRLFSLPEADYKNMREACRKLVEKRFSLTTMADSYENIYNKLTA